MKEIIVKRLPNKPNETYEESCERKAAILDFIYQVIQKDSAIKINPIVSLHIKKFIENCNDESIE